MDFMRLLSLRLAAFLQMAFVLVSSSSAQSEQAKLLAGDGAALDRLGHCVSVSGDTAVLGAPANATNGAVAGAAYVYVRSAMGWTQEAKLIPDDGLLGDFFASSVSVSGETVVVGAYMDDDGGSASGSAYVFVRSGMTWTQEAKLSANGGGAGDRFGYSVSVSGQRALVGAPYDDVNSMSDCGSAYVFGRSGTNWIQEYRFIGSDAGPADEIGNSVSLSHDKALVGAHRSDDSPWFSTGAVYFLERNGGNWAESARLTASDSEAGDWFGFSVSVSGDTAILGVPFADDLGPQCGAAYFFWLGECDPGTPYCFGEVGTCPCANAAGPTAGCQNSHGNGAILSSKGTSSTSSDDLEFDAAQLPAGKSCLLFSGDLEVNMLSGDGIRCVGGSLNHLGVRTSDGAGNATWSAGLATAGGWESGDTRYFQVWYRDSVASPCGSGFNISSGLEVTFCP